MRTVSISILVFGLIVGHAQAISFPPNVSSDAYDPTPDGVPTANGLNDGIPDLFDAVNQLLGTTHDHNEDIDSLMINPAGDDLWTLPTGNGLVALIGLTAGNANTLGFYTDPGTGLARTSLLGPNSGFGFVGDGTSANPYPAASMAAPGAFGFYLDSSGTKYYSEPALNPAGFEHVMSFDMSALAGTSVWLELDSIAQEHTFINPVLVGWEDLPWNESEQTLGDEDYDDMIYLVDAMPASSVPDGGLTLALLGMSMVGIARLRKRS